MSRNSRSVTVPGVLSVSHRNEFLKWRHVSIVSVGNDHSLYRSGFKLHYSGVESEGLDLYMHSLLRGKKLKVLHASASEPRISKVCFSCVVFEWNRSPG